MVCTLCCIFSNFSVMEQRNKLDSRIEVKSSSIFGIIIWGSGDKIKLKSANLYVLFSHRFI